MKKPEGFHDSYDKYYEYLQSDRWQKIRNDRLKMDHFHCQICGSPKQLHVHHLFYPAEYGTETTNDCITVCENCHGILETLKKKGQLTIRNRICFYKIEADVRAQSQLEIYDFLDKNDIRTFGGIYVYFMSEKDRKIVGKIETDFYGLSVVSKYFGSDMEINVKL